MLKNLTNPQCAPSALAPPLGLPFAAEDSKKFELNQPTCGYAYACSQSHFERCGCCLKRAQAVFWHLVTVLRCRPMAKKNK